MAALRSCLLIIAVFIQIESAAQLEYANWYFGDKAGISFLSGSPVPLLDGELSTMEGVSTISDSNGRLLFYTNGKVVYNRIHQVMPNGAGLTGHSSTTQSSLIVQSVTDDSIYYLFTVPAQMGVLGGMNYLCYSTIDMREDGGLGDIVNKNEVLLSDVCEKITATRHANNRDVWVTIHRFGTNEYYSYPVTCTGVGAPVISHTGAVIHNDCMNNYSPSIGCMKISGNGKKIAAAWQYWNTIHDADSWLQIADFDNGTGRVSNPVIISHDDPGKIERGYGVEFSPSSSRLYFSEFGSSSNVSFGKVYQYDVTSSDIASTEIVVGNDHGEFGSIQLAPDHKIYIARFSMLQHLSVIHHPDVSGMGCFLDEPGISVAPNNCTWGLPNNWDNFKDERTTLEAPDVIPFNTVSFCKGTLCELNATWQQSGAVSYLWNTGATDAVYYVDQPGQYTVRLGMYCDTLFDTVTVNEIGFSFSLGDDLQMCYNGKAIPVDGPEGYAAYWWNVGSSSSEYAIADTGLYILTVTDKDGCTASDALQVHRDHCKCDVYVPSAFTNNNDGRNDEFRIYSDCFFNSFRFVMVNRWGQTVFSSDDPAFRWMGLKDDGQSIYSWKMVYEADDGSGDKTTLFGNVVSLH